MHEGHKVGKYFPFTRRIRRHRTNDLQRNASTKTNTESRRDLTKTVPALTTMLTEQTTTSIERSTTVSRMSKISLMTQPDGLVGRCKRWRISLTISLTVLVMASVMLRDSETTSTMLMMLEEMISDMMMIDDTMMIIDGRCWIMVTIVCSLLGHEPEETSTVALMHGTYISESFIFHLTGATTCVTDFTQA